MFVTVNPNYTDHALGEIERCVARGAIGVKLLASRRADDPLLDPIAELAAEARIAGAASHLAAPTARVAVARDL